MHAAGFWTTVMGIYGGGGVGETVTPDVDQYWPLRGTTNYRGELRNTTNLRVEANNVGGLHTTIRGDL